MIRRPIPDHDELALRDFGAQPAQHIDDMLAIGPCIGPDPHLAFVVKIQAIERDFGGQARRRGGDIEALAALAPAMTEIDILVDMRLIEIDQRMLLIASAIQ